MTTSDDRVFWQTVRRALMMLVKAIEQHKLDDPDHSDREGYTHVTSNARRVK
jgi:hypothetical protein